MTIFLRKPFATFFVRQDKFQPTISEKSSSINSLKFYVETKSSMCSFVQHSRVLIDRFVERALPFELMRVNLSSHFNTFDKMFFPPLVYNWIFEAFFSLFSFQFLVEIKFQSGTIWNLGNFRRWRIFSEECLQLAVEFVFCSKIYRL